MSTILFALAYACLLVVYLAERRDAKQYKLALDKIGLAVHEYQCLPDWESRDNVVAKAERYSHTNEQGNPLIAEYEWELELMLYEEELC